MEREIYEVDLGRTVSDDKPERKYYTGQNSWRGQAPHRLSGQGHKLTRLHEKNMSVANRKLLADAINTYINTQAEISGDSTPTEYLAE